MRAEKVDIEIDLMRAEKVDIEIDLMRAEKVDIEIDLMRAKKDVFLPRNVANDIAGAKQVAYKRFIAAIAKPARPPANLNCHYDKNAARNPPSHTRKMNYKNCISLVSRQTWDMNGFQQTFNTGSLCEENVDSSNHV
ncbi:hypothetical protein ACJJTC_019345 [Scirpophaga incertulas]